MNEKLRIVAADGSVVETDRQPGLTENRFGVSFYEPAVRTVFDVVDLTTKSGELMGEVTVRCSLEGIRVQLDDDRVRQGRLNFHSVRTRAEWAKALREMSPADITFSWENLLERFCQSVLDFNRLGAIRGGLLTGQRRTGGGRPWAAYPIIPDHESATLYSRGGAGKTTLMAGLTLACALGKSLIPGIRVDRPYRIVYLDWETNVETANDLWGFVAESYKTNIPSSIWYEPMDVPLERSGPKVAQIVDKHRADFAVIDSVQMAMLSSGDYSDAAESITRLHQILRRLRIWALLIDHISSEDLRSRKVPVKAYGSVFKGNIARHTIAFHVAERTATTAKLYLLCPKSNLMRDQWAMSGTFERTDEKVGWEFGDNLDYGLYNRLMGIHDDVDEERPQQPGEINTSERRVLDALGRHHDDGGTIEGLMMELDLKENTLRSLLRRLKVDGLVWTPPGTGGRGVSKRWMLTQEGLLETDEDGRWGLTQKGLDEVNE